MSNANHDQQTREDEQDWQLRDEHDDQLAGVVLQKTDTAWGVDPDEVREWAGAPATPAPMGPVLLPDEGDVIVQTLDLDKLTDSEAVFRSVVERTLTRQQWEDAGRPTQVRL